MPKITAEIKKALSSLIEQEGSALELSRKTGISHSTFSKYMSGQIQKINQANWKILMPFLNPYLKNVDSVVINNNSGTAAGIVPGNMGSNPIGDATFIVHFQQITKNPLPTAFLLNSSETAFSVCNLVCNQQNKLRSN